MNHKVRAESHESYSLKLEITFKLVDLIRNFLINILNGNISHRQRIFPNKIMLQERLSLSEDLNILGIEFDLEKLDSLAAWIDLIRSSELIIYENLTTSEMESHWTSVKVDRSIVDNRFTGRFKDVPQLFSALQASDSEGVSLFLHGSMADHTYTPFSDIDDLLVIRKESWRSPEKFFRTANLFSKMARDFQNIDPFQHHGHWILTELDLLLYRQSYCPLIVLEGAYHIFGDNTFEVNLISDTQGFIRNAHLTVKSIQNRLDKLKRSATISLFDLKCLVGEILIVPAYLFQSRGHILSKPDAIARAKELFSDDAINAIIFATKIRQDFGILMSNSRIFLASACAQIICSRRPQAEKLHRLSCSQISSQRLRKYQSNFLESIAIFAKETEQIIR